MRARSPRHSPTSITPQKRLVSRNSDGALNAGVPGPLRVRQYESALRLEAILLCDNFRSGCRRERCLPGSSPSVEHPRFSNRWHALASQPPWGLQAAASHRFNRYFAEYCGNSRKINSRTITVRLFHKVWVLRHIMPYLTGRVSGAGSAVARHRDFFPGRDGFSPKTSLS
jgi:hypothetical protein